MSERSPVYAIKNQAARIVSVPSGLWRVQVLGSTAATREHDPWQNRSHPDAKAQAMRALGEYNHAH